jgi:phosphatidylglycerol:prolipoprotein diacylglycerol transferase
VIDLFPLRYVLPVLLGLIVLLTWPIAPSREKRRYWQLQLITLLGALAGAKLVVLTGDRFWPVVPLHGWMDFLTSGRSIVGGLFFGFLAAEAAKPLLGYTLPPNDRFAAVLPFSLAIGRIGCFLQGCCAGLPHEGLLSMTDARGVARYPTQLFEAAFHIAFGIFAIVVVRRGVLQGRVFATFLMAYGVFRFLTEFVRVTPRVLHGYSVYQAWCLVMIALGAMSFALRSRREEELVELGEAR